MKKPGIFKAVALGLLSLTVIGGPQVAEGAPTCIAFNAGMVDAAATAADMVFVENIDASDDPALPSIRCQIDTADGSFGVQVNSPPAMSAAVFGSNTTSGDETFVRAGAEDLTPAQLHACRAVVLQTFVWNRHCAAGLQ